MEQALIESAGVLLAGVRHLVAHGGPNVIMLLVAGLLLYLAVAKEVEPLLLLPISFGCILVNLPLSEVFLADGFLHRLYEVGIATELFPLLIFIGIGAMIDFSPLLANPRILLFGAAGQLGIFLTVALALAFGFTPREAVSIGAIGACDGPTVIFVSSQFAPHLLGAASVAAYSYMALVPIIQPPIMRLLTTPRERRVHMPRVGHHVSRTALILFPLVTTALVGVIAPKGIPLVGTLMFGNLMRVSGVVPRLVQASENEIANITTLLLGLTIGATMEGHAFLHPRTLLVLGLGLVAICVDTVGGVLFGKLACRLSGWRINPLVGAAGISAYPMAARIVQTEGQRHDKHNHLLMHAIGANTGGQIGSIVAAALMLAVMKGLGVG
jgi:oxaloacetate decarboxylase beta subunit